MAKRDLGAASHAHDASSLRRVTRALESVTRKGCVWAHDLKTRFPLPALAFKGDYEDELPLPLRRQDVSAFKARATVSQRDEGVDVAWEVRGDLVESRNPEWDEFMDERLLKIRMWLGVFEREEVEMPLRKMVLAETGARLLVGEQDEAISRPDGAFGTVVMVLPGSFEGGEVWVRHKNNGQTGDNEDNEEEELGEYWWPEERDHAYSISYAALYDHCRYVAEPLQSGSALCLVFDLVATPNQAAFLRGPQQAQRCVDAALLDYFRAAPEPLVKRLKISSDAWKTVTEFAVDRNFVYLLRRDGDGDREKSFDDLTGDELLIAESLARFCAESNGRYVLYLAQALCSHYTDARSKSGSPGEEHPETAIPKADRKVTLKAPWRKYGDSTPSDIPPVYLDHHRDVVPMGRVEQLPLTAQRSYHRDMVDFDIVEHLYGRRYVEWVGHTTHALVVQPALVEEIQLTRVPISEAVVRLRAKLSDSRDEAIRYGRHVLAYRPKWRVDPNSLKGFPDLVKLFVEINDLQLFKMLLLSVELREYDKSGTLMNAVQHFGWDACERTVIDRLVSSPTMCGCVNLFASIVDPCMNADRVDTLLDVLLSLHPWTNLGMDRSSVGSQDLPYRHFSDFHRLLDIVYQSSPQRLIQVVSVTHVHELVLVVAPGVASFVEAHATDELVWRVLVHVREQFKTMAPYIRNSPYSEVSIADHCGVCRDLKAFLSSTVVETEISCTEALQVDHIKTVLECCRRAATHIDIDVVGATVVRLTKRPQDDGLVTYHAETEERRMAEMLARSDRPTLRDLPSTDN